MYSGIDSICTIGLMKALTRPKITATTKMMPTRLQRRVAADEMMPGTMRVTSHSASPVSAGTKAETAPWSILPRRYRPARRSR